MTELRPVLHRSVDDVDVNPWNNLVTQSDRGTLFHRTEWLRAIEEGLDWRPRHVAVERRGDPVAMMPNFVCECPDLSELAAGLSLGADGGELPDASVLEGTIDSPLRRATCSHPYGAPFGVTDERECLDMLFDRFEAANGRRVLFHSIKSYDLEAVRYGCYLDHRGYESRVQGCHFVIDLNRDWDAVLADMDKERRKAIRRANEQDDVRVEIHPLGEDLDTTYDHYVRNMERVGSPPQPKSLFESLSEHVSDRVRVCRAVVDGDDVGRYVYLLDDEGSMLHHWLSAIPDESCFEAYPSELIHEFAIRWGIEREYDGYGFGPSNAHFGDSVFRFKQKYGGRAVPMFELEKGYSALAWPLYRFGRSKLSSPSL